MTDSVRVGVLSLHNSKETKAICNAVDGLGHQSEWLREENTLLRIKDGEATVEPDVDVVANRLLLSNTKQPCEELGLVNTIASLRPTLNPPEATLLAIHKFATAAVLGEAGIQVPSAVMALSAERLNAVRGEFGEEAVYKTAIGTHGGGTWKVGIDEQVSAKVGNRYAFLQTLLERDEEKHRDVRVYVVDDRVVGAMFRYAPENDWRTNVALGGEVEDATSKLPASVEETAIEATDALGLDYAGVDLVEGENGWFVLEVNPTAGFKGLYRATDRSPAPFIAKLAIERVGGTVDEDRVRELAATLDDSTPNCKPRLTHGSSERATIGYTEQVVVSGTQGSTRVIGKADTGATRTSIDTGLAAEVGAGPIKQTTRVKSGSSKEPRSRPLVDIVVGVGGTQHTVTASVEDRSHMDYRLLLGRDILTDYQVDVGRRYDELTGERDTDEE
jgi:RimK family alpha-L-glutamate ligase